MGWCWCCHGAAWFRLPTSFAATRPNYYYSLSTSKRDRGRGEQGLARARAPGMTMCPDEDWVPDKMCEVRTRAVLPAVAIEFCILHNIIDPCGRPAMHIAFAGVRGVRPGLQPHAPQGQSTTPCHPARRLKQNEPVRDPALHCAPRSTTAAAAGTCSAPSAAARACHC